MTTFKIEQRGSGTTPEKCDECQDEQYRFTIQLGFGSRRYCPSCLDRMMEKMRKSFSDWFRKTQ